MTETHDVARRLLAQGWSPLPLPPNAKSEPPSGTTGYRGRYTTTADLDRWDWDGNLAIRLPPDVIGLDVDVYKGGDVSLTELESRYGPLPATVMSTSREDGSGIALFRVPVGTTLVANPAAAIEMIQAHHRYMIVWPSIHPEGRIYQWVDCRSGEADVMDPADAPPPIDELPVLPWAWTEGLATTKTDAAAAATTERVREFIAVNTTNSRPQALNGVRAALNGYRGSRHDTLVATACWALREAAAGLYSVDAALDVLHGWWAHVMDDPHRRDGDEFAAAILWAVAQVDAEPQRIAEIRDRPATPTNIDTNTGEVAADWRNLPHDFWTTSDRLAHIRRAAHSRARCADAVLLFTLARIAATIHPSIKLPPIVGSRASLNFLGGVVSASGGGKTSAGDVARELIPIDRKDVVADIPPGSGEGLTELYFEWVPEEGPDGKTRKVKRKTRNGAYIYLDEGQALAEMGNRKGATLLPTLRSAWSGATLGQSNASQETHRVVQAHSYRMSIMVGFQLEYAAELVNDAAGGTPQRFVFANAIDPTIPDQPCEWPGEIDIINPPVNLAVGTEMAFDPDIADEIYRRALMTARGEYEPDPLDTHRDLARMKVAALLAILHDRLYVGVDDWERAGIIMRTSTAVRTWVIEHARTTAQRSEAAYAAKLADRAAVVEGSAEERALDQGARSIGRKMHRSDDEVVPASTLIRAVAGRCRKLVSVEDMLSLAEEKGWITPVRDGYSAGESRPT